MADNSIGPGTVLAGRFRLEDLLHESGGARHWRATDQILARSVAVHVVAASDARADDLLDAARASATVSDNHFLRCLDAAHAEDVVYVVNEWGAGTSLDTILADGPLSPRRAAWLVKEVAEAINNAHGEGLAHGRLRPESVLVTEAGSVKVVGLAVDAALSGGSQPAPAESDQGGEPHADVVALGALLYATLVGRWPGPVESRLPEAPRENGRLLRPRQVRAGVPRPLDAVCERVLNPEHHGERIGSVHGIGEALHEYLASRSASTTEAEATSLIGAGGLAERNTPTDTPPDTPRDTAANSPANPAGVGGPPWAPAAAMRPPADPEATQAGAPLFYDDRSSVGWARPVDQGPRAAPSPQPQAPPPRPPAWGPDADQDAGWSTSGPSSGRGGSNAGKRWLVLAAVIAACLAVAFIVVLVFNLGDGSGGQQAAEPESPASSSGAESPGPARPVSIATVSDFDPEGDPPEENPEDAALAIDDNPATTWQTSTYYDPLELQKDGVGLLVDLGEQVDVSSVRLTLVGSPTDLQLLAAPDSTTAPTTTAGLKPVGSATDAGTTVDIDLEEPVTTRYLVVWLTSLPAVDGGFRGQIAEIAVRS